MTLWRRGQDCSLFGVCCSEYQGEFGRSRGRYSVREDGRPGYWTSTVKVESRTVVHTCSEAVRRLEKDLDWSPEPRQESKETRAQVGHSAFNSVTYRFVYAWLQAVVTGVSVFRYGRLESAYISCVYFIVRVVRRWRPCARRIAPGPIVVFTAILL